MAVAGAPSGGGASGRSTPRRAASAPSHVESSRRRSCRRDVALPVGADLAALGAELTPRQYAAPREKTEVVAARRAARPRRLALQPRSRSRPRLARPAAVPGAARRRPDARLRGSARAHRSRDLRARRRRRREGAHRLARQRRARRPAGFRGRLAGDERRPAPDDRRGEARVGRGAHAVGTLAVGRMGAHFGLGIAANGGDCEDCDHGDCRGSPRVRRRRSPATCIALAYDIASCGPVHAVARTAAARSTSSRATRPPARRSRS